MPEISKERIVQLASEAIDSMQGDEHPLNSAIRRGIREGLEVAARNCEYWAAERKRVAEKYTDVPTVRALAADAEAIAHNIRAITIEGEQR